MYLGARSIIHFTDGTQFASHDEPGVLKSRLENAHKRGYATIDASDVDGYGETIVIRLIKRISTYHT